ncbi:hypothetical protein [uncultured Desulfobacter sp.]|uniref:hypothetical protein n=1 Tax=uncultured Desulfobacter sp. TaxID=240139 RepID=UPI002AAAC21B|nr:hypothetical protein [uncultured Desulfobacter sp.]
MNGTNEITGFWNSSGGELAARMALDVWSGKIQIGNIIPQRIKTQIIYVNKGNADRLGIHISPFLLKIANEVYK